MRLKKYIQLQTFFGHIDLAAIYEKSHGDKVLVASRMAELCHQDYRLCYEYLDWQLKIKKQNHSQISEESFQNMKTIVPVRDRSLNKCLLSAFIIGVIASIAIGLNSLLIVLEFFNIIELNTLANSWLILLQWLVIVTGTVFSGIGTFSRYRWSTLVSGILFACSACLYLPYSIIPLVMAALAFVGFKQQHEH